VALGTAAVRQAIRAEEACLVILAADAAPGQLKKLEGLLEHREVSVRWMESREALGVPMGIPALSAVAITKQSFAEQLLISLPRRSRTGSATRGAEQEPKEESSTNAGR
jgi:ribosomal protein L7Ae-like RNA K-turn-binding protein